MLRQAQAERLRYRSDVVTGFGAEAVSTCLTEASHVSGCLPFVGYVVRCIALFVLAVVVSSEAVSEVRLGKINSYTRYVVEPPFAQARIPGTSDEHQRHNHTGEENRFAESIVLLHGRIAQAHPLPEQLGDAECSSDQEKDADQLPGQHACYDGNCPDEGDSYYHDEHGLSFRGNLFQSKELQISIMEELIFVNEE